MVAQTQKLIKMIKEITISLAQQDELLNVDMTSFREANLAQSIRDTNKWWINNFLPNAVIQRIDRVGALTYKIQYFTEWIDECESSIFDGRTNYAEMYD